MPYIVTVLRVDTAAVLNTVTCPDLPSALRVKSRAFRSYHFSDLGGLVVVPPTMDFDDWGDVDRLRYGNGGPYIPVRVSIHHTADEPSTPSRNEASPPAPSTAGSALMARGRRR